MTADKTLLSVNLPYNQSSHYWLAVFTPPDSTALCEALAAKGMRPMASRENIYTLRINDDWAAKWAPMVQLIIRDIASPDRQDHDYVAVARRQLSAFLSRFLERRSR